MVPMGAAAQALDAPPSQAGKAHPAAFVDFF